MAPDDKITNDEMVGLFGDTIPMDVAILLERWHGGDPEGLRLILQHRAEAYHQERQPNEELIKEVEAWRETFPVAGFDGNGIVLSG